MMAFVTWAWFSAECVGRAQPRPERASPSAKRALQTVYYGVIVCADCHESPKRSEPEPVLCRCTEVKVWNEQDKHKDAFLVLRSERAKRMSLLLGIKDAATEKSCLSCHGVDVRDPDVKIDKTFKPEEGVSCVACHGAHAEWVDTHGARLQREKWRSLSRGEKERDYGMTDLWNPATRAKTCAACHIGDGQQGKVVTHAMYAAGHPPLPGLEVATFSNAMPRHWQDLKEKKAEVQKLLSFSPGEHEETKAVVVGGIIELKQTMDLLAAQAALRTRAGQPDEQFLDLAQVDCYACHHELQIPSWRQERGYPGMPGRPQFRQWPLALIKLGLHHAGQDQKATEFDKKLRALQSAFASQPFGKLPDVVRAAGELADWCKQLEIGLSKPSCQYDQTAAIRLLRYVCAMSAAEIPDYDSARQMAWAFRIIYSELDPKPANDPKFQEKLRALDEELKLSLPSGQQHRILSELPLALQKVSNYDPGKFQQTFQELARMLPSK
jgi:hypothetical protein